MTLKKMLYMALYFAATLGTLGYAIGWRLGRERGQQEILHELVPPPGGWCSCSTKKVVP